MSGDTDELRAMWDARYRDRPDEWPQAAQVLRDNKHLLPTAGDALDLACGMGGNALLLADAGLRVRAWDLSPVGIESLQNRHVAGQLVAEVRDVCAAPPVPNSFDVIVISYFLERRLFAALTDALRPGGLLFYQTFIRDKAQAVGPGNPEFLLADNELLAGFGALRVLVYREEGRTGDVAHGFRNEAMFVGQRR